jgi:hypothetical protein
MHLKKSITIRDASIYLNISEDLIKKFITLGFIKPMDNDGTSIKLSAYNLRRLKQVLDLYEKSFSPEKIEVILNN